MTMRSSFSVLIAAVLLAIPVTGQQVDGSSAAPTRDRDPLLDPAPYARGRPYRFGELVERG